MQDDTVCGRSLFYGVLLHDSDETGVRLSLCWQHPYDNAVMECFFKYLKKEETDRRNYKSLGELYHSLFTYINGFYNSVRPHSHNNGLSPNQKEALFMPV